MCRVLNMSEFWIFVNFRKYDRVLNMCRDIIMEGFWIFQDSKYVKFLHMQALHKVLNVPEYRWVITYGRLLNMPGQRSTVPVLNQPGLRIWTRLWRSEGYKGCWICLNKSEYALIMSHYEWICLNNAEYDWICQGPPEKAERWICQNSECFWCST